MGKSTKALGTTSLHSLAQRLGISYTTLHRWYHNPKKDKRGNGTQSLIKYLLSLSDTELDQIFKEF